MGRSEGGPFVVVVPPSTPGAMVDVSNIVAGWVVSFAMVVGAVGTKLL